VKLEIIEELSSQDQITYEQAKCFNGACYSKNIPTPGRNNEHHR